MKSPDLLNRLVAEVQKNVAGETNTIKTIHVCAHGRLVKNRAATSCNLGIHSKSGAGKDWTMRQTLSILPGGQVIKRSRVSPKALTYMKPVRTWNGHILYLEDISNSVLNDEVMKLLASGGNGTSTIVVKGKALDITIKGSPIIFFTSATANLSQDNLRRFTLIRCDESKQQTRRIIGMAARKACHGMESSQPDENIRKALALLKPVEVRVPYAGRLQRLITDNLIARTVFGRFLDYIKASAALHQFQRESVKAGVILATPQDYDIARKVFLKTKNGRELIPTSNVDEALFSVLAKSKEGLTTKEIETHVPYEYHNVLQHLNKLFDAGLIEKHSVETHKRGRPHALWIIKVSTKFVLPTSKELGI